MSLRIHTRSCKNGKPGNFGVFRFGWGRYDWLKKRELVKRDEFAPSAHLLRMVKDGFSLEKFAIRYIQEMKEMYKKSPDTWDHLLQHEEITLCCYEENPQECHRSILARLIKEYAISKGIEVTMDIQ